MKSIFRTLLSAAIVAGISACNSGGFTQPIGQLCAADDGVLTMTPNSIQKKISLKPGDGIPDELPEGNYAYVHGDLYFKEGAATPTPLIFHVSDSPNADGTSTPHFACMRNARIGMAGMDGSTTTITDIVVCPDKKVITTRTYKFQVAGGVVNWGAASRNPPIIGDPGDVFPDPNDPKDNAPDKVIDKVIFANGKTNATNYEVRSKISSPYGDFYTLTSMTYTKCPPTGCPACITGGSAAP